VLRHNDVERANESCRFAFVRAQRRAARCRLDATTRATKSVRREVVVSMTSPHMRRPSQVNPVRQCARRGAVDPGVAQASPLFSDHAPREVHLWQ
jgi:hypothetical protein